MQTPPIPPAPPQPPAITLVPSATTPGGVIAQVSSQSTLSYRQLMARADELSTQLKSATSRRSNLSRELRRAPESLRDGMQAQITELNGRIVRIEQDIAVNGQLRVNAKGQEAAAGTNQNSDYSGFPMPSPDDMTPIIIVFTLFVLCPIALALSRLIWKRGTRMGMQPPVSRESDKRMERVEQAVDAIAVEVERISEGQRFVTQLMTQQPALGEGAAQPVRVAAADPVVAGWQAR